MFSSKDLIKEQLEAGAKKRPRPIKPVKFNKQAGRSYNSDLQKLVAAVKRDIDAEIVPLIKALEPQYIRDATFDGWMSSILVALATLSTRWMSAQFIGAATRVAGTFIGDISASSSKRFAESVKTIGLDVYGDSPKLSDMLSDSIADNTRLIKTIPAQYLGQVESTVIANMRAGLRPSAIVSQLSKQYDVSKKRAAVIARDQTAKAHGEINKQRQLDAGFDHFRWLDSDDSRVRTRHRDIANTDVGHGVGVYRWDKLPKSDDGSAISPGSDYQCRCNAQPVSAREVAERGNNG